MSEYYYTAGWLRTLHDNYEHIYDCIENRLEQIIVTDPMSLVEYKADFDNARKEAGLNFRKMADILNGVELKRFKWLIKVKDNEMFTSQVEYNRFYDDMRKYAMSQAAGLFSGEALINEAAEKAIDKFTLYLEKHDWGKGLAVEEIEALGKKIIADSVNESGRKRTLDYAGQPQDVEGFTIYQVVGNRKPPVVNVLDLPPRDRLVCLLYWQEGKTHQQIATVLQVSRPYITQIIAKYQSS